MDSGDFSEKESTVYLAAKSGERYFFACVIGNSSGLEHFCSLCHGGKSEHCLAIAKTLSDIAEMQIDSI